MGVQASPRISEEEGLLVLLGPSRKGQKGRKGGEKGREKPDFKEGRPDLATGKYGCIEVRVYPAECGEQLGRDP